LRRAPRGPGPHGGTAGREGAGPETVRDTPPEKWGPAALDVAEPARLCAAVQIAARPPRARGGAGEPRESPAGRG